MIYFMAVKTCEARTKKKHKKRKERKTNRIEIAWLVCYGLGCSGGRVTICPAALLVR